MLEANITAAKKFNIDTQLIERRANTQKNVEILGNDLTFIGVREFERTKHVHRLHPYLGKFIPQLVEVFLRDILNRLIPFLTLLSVQEQHSCKQMKWAFIQ